MHISKSVHRIVADARGGGGRILVSPSLIHLRRRDHQQRSRNWPDRRKKERTPETLRSAIHQINHQQWPGTVSDHPIYRGEKLYRDTKYGRGRVIGGRAVG